MKCATRRCPHPPKPVQFLVQMFKLRGLGKLLHFLYLGFLIYKTIQQNGVGVRVRLKIDPPGIGLAWHAQSHGFNPQHSVNQTWWFQQVGMEAE